MNWLKGKKTMLGAVAGGALVIAHATGWIDAQTFQVIGGFIVTWTGVSLRLAVKG